MSSEDVIRLEEQIKTLFNNEARIEQNRKEDRAWTEKCLGEINDKLDKLANRLPIWATLLIGALMGACGWLAKR